MRTQSPETSLPTLRPTRCAQTSMLTAVVPCDEVKKHPSSSVERRLGDRRCGSLDLAETTSPGGVELIIAAAPRKEVASCVGLRPNPPREARLLQLPLA